MLGVLDQMMLLMLLLTLEDSEAGHGLAPAMHMRRCHDFSLLPCLPWQSHACYPMLQELLLRA